MNNVTQVSKQFSLYDFLGYFIPGAVVIYIGVYILQSFEIYDQIIIDKPKYDSITLSVVFIVFSYVIGHAVNYLSSITIEKYSIWIFGYPSKYLLGKQNYNYFKSIKDCTLVHNRFVKCFLVKLVKFISILPYHEKILTNTFFRSIKCLKHYPYFISVFWRSLLWLFILPISLQDFIFGKIFKLRLLYTNPLDDKLIQIIKDKKRQLLLNLQIINKDEGDVDFDFNRVLYHYYFEKCQNHVSKFENYIALYGFTRSISMILNLACYVYVFMLFFQKLENIDIYNMIILILLLLFSYLFYMAFLKFYRKYTVECLMCLVIDEQLIVN